MKKAAKDQGPILPGQLWRPEYKSTMAARERDRKKAAIEAARAENLADTAFEKLQGINFFTARPGRMTARRRTVGAHEIFIVRMPEAVRAGEAIDAREGLVIALADAARGDEAPAVARGPVALPGPGAAVKAGDEIRWPNCTRTATSTLNQGSSTPVGIALADAPADAPTVLVRLGG